MGGFPWYLRADVISHFQYPWRVIPQSEGLLHREGMLCEVRVIASHMFIDGLISCLQKILLPTICFG
jgi:hypothetical protein